MRRASLSVGIVATCQTCQRTWNTIVNTYYEYAFVGLETKGEFAHPSSVALEGGLMKGLEKFFRDAAHLEAAVGTLPDMIRAMRGMRDGGKHKGYRLAVSFTLDVFKYRIPNAD